MAEFIAKRVLSALPLLVLLVTVTFFLTHLMPGDAATAITDQSPLASAVDIERIRERLGLDEPLLAQYAKYMGGVITGDLGSSLFTSTPVTQLLQARIGATIALAAIGTFIAIILGVTAGVVAGLRPDGVVDRGTTALATLGIAMPNFWVGLLLVWIFAVKLGWFPASGFGQSDEPWSTRITSLVLPGIAMGTSAASNIARQTRSSFVGVMERDLITALRIRGIPRRSIVLKHALKNASIPVVTTIGVLTAGMLGGAIVIEQVFAFPGIGSLALTAVYTRDIPVVQGVVLIVAVIVTVINIGVDVVYALLDPRAREQLT